MCVDPFISDGCTSVDNNILRTKFYSNINKTKNNCLEKNIQEVLHSQLGGEIEVTTIHGKIDLLTDNSIIEIKTYKNYLSALGQIIGYSELYPDKKKKIYLFDVPLCNKIKVIKSLYKKNNVKLIIYNYLDNQSIKE